MSTHSALFDDWIRTHFVELNSELEQLYSQQDDKANVDGIGEAIKQQLKNEGNALISNLLAEGNTDEGFDNAFDLLGNVGLFMAACRRHEITEPSRETTSPLIEASALAMHIGASIGVTPRFATAHLTT
uniref:monodechloroaminopyrrolnitrin synthase PrnB family protein n=1 Tax=Pseudoalteromonas sp. TaxID=53249 RepID=UPI0035695D54